MKEINTKIEIIKLENKGVEWVENILEAFKVDWEEYVNRLSECTIKGVEYGIDKRVQERPKDL